MMSMSDDLDWRDGPGVAVAMSACAGCHRVFMYDPDKVPSVRMSAELSALIEHHETVHGQDQAAADCPECRDAYAPLFTEAVREPICPACCQRVNPERAARGFEPFPVHDTAEALARGGRWPT
jgi:hypothetical protein